MSMKVSREGGLVTAARFARTISISVALLAAPASAQLGRSPPGAPGGDGSLENPYRMPPGYRGSAGDEMALELDRRIHGYAGTYLDREHDQYVVRIKRGQPWPSVAMARKALLDVQGGPEEHLERLAFEDADRDMAELVAMKDRVRAAWVTREMSSVSIDVMTGRLKIAVRDPKNAPGTEDMLKRLGIAADAVEIVLEYPPVIIDRTGVPFPMIYSPPPP